MDGTTSRCLIGVVCALACASTTRSSQDFIFDDCGVADYYDMQVDVDEWSALQKLTASKHRNTIPYTSASNRDVWDAMLDLDGDGDNTVNLIYAQTTVPYEPKGTSGSWNREHLWPRSLGLGSSGPDYTDVHNLRPADATINSSRGNKFYGSCGNEEGCNYPAHPEAFETTHANSTVFAPPENVRGDIARAIFYMALRYNGAATATDGKTTTDLILSNCPEMTNFTMGYLDTLLQWHEEDMVDEAEMIRNNRVCSHWQGNRNPFVDFPELVATHFGSDRGASDAVWDCSGGQPQPFPDDEIESADGTCKGLQAGDLFVIGFNSPNQDDVMLVATQDLSPGITFYVTDNAWTGNEFSTSEGTLKFVVPSSGIRKGNIISLSDNPEYMTSFNEWQPEGGNFNLAMTGDTIQVYCVEQDDEIRHVHSLKYGSSSWVLAVGIDNNNSSRNHYDTKDASLPPTMRSSGVLLALGKGSHWYYNGTRDGFESQQQALLALSDLTNWAGSNTDPIPSSIVTSPFDMEYKLVDITTLGSDSSGAFTKPRFSMLRLSSWALIMLSCGIALISSLIFG